MTLNNPVLACATAYARAGLSIIPTSKATKTPCIQWTTYQTRRASTEQIQEWFASVGLCIGIVCGKVSGGLEMIDFDHKAELYPAWAEIVEQEAPGLLSRLVREETQSGGLHVVYRCPAMAIPGNLKLAQRGIEAPGPDEIEIEGKKYKPRRNGERWHAILTLIETRGEGGQFLAAPSPGYKLIQGDYMNLPEITPDERRVLIQAALALNEWIEPSKVHGQNRKALEHGEGRPGDDFNARADVPTWLERHGWQFDGPEVERGGSRFQHFRRPGKSHGRSASLIDGRVFYCFSSNAAPFEPGEAYSPFGVYAYLEHEGDFEAAAKDLARMGYGEKGGGDSQPPEEDQEKHLLPAPVPFPVHVLPGIYRAAVEQAARAFCVPVEMPACALLVLASTCIGRSRGLTIKTSWSEHPNLYLALVARSGSGKSPCTKAFLNSMFRVEKKWFREWQEASAEYLRQYEEWNAERKTRKKDAGSIGTPPEKPTQRQLYLDDATVESLTDALAGNSRGILWYRDELAGLLMDLDKYQGKDGATKTRLMSAYDSGPWKTSRIGQGRTNFIPHATLSIFGTVQPAALPTIFSDLDAATGFLPRFMFVRASSDTPAVWTEESFDQEHMNALDHLTEKLLRLEFGQDGEPRFIGIQADAKAAYIEWHDRQAVESWTDFDAQTYEALSAKLRGQALRLCLLLHCLEAVADGRSEMAPVTLETMQKALALADWFKSQQRQIWAYLGKAGQVTEVSPLEKRVGAAILSLEAEIQAGALATAKIAEAVNTGAAEKYRVDVRSVGRACTSLGLGQKRTRDARLVTITPAKLEEIRAACSPRACDVCDITKRNVTDSNPRQSWACDVSDVSDVFSGTNPETCIPDEVEI